VAPDLASVLAEAAAAAADERPAPPPRPSVSLIDVAVGAGSLAVRAGAPVLRLAGHVGGGACSRARRVIAPAMDPALDWAVWATQSLAEVGSMERRRAKTGVHGLIGTVGSAVAAEPGVQRMVRELADSQLDPLVEKALPMVLDRLNKDPEAVRQIVQDQSAGIMTEATQSARHTARHADDVVDTLTHRFFHRTGRHPEATVDAGGEQDTSMNGDVHANVNGNADAGTESQAASQATDAGPASPESMTATATASALTDPSAPRSPPESRTP
jgi:hypothetical protein